MVYLVFSLQTGSSSWLKTPSLPISLACQYCCCAGWAVSCSLSIHLQAPVHDIYLIALKCVCAEMIRNHEGPVSLLRNASHITPPSFILYLSSRSRVSHVDLSWNPRPGVRQTSGPLSVCQICTLGLMCSSCSVSCFQDLWLFSCQDRWFIYPKAQFLTLLNKSTISGTLMSLIVSEAGKNFQVIEDIIQIWLSEIYFWVECILTRLCPIQCGF